MKKNIKRILATMLTVVMILTAIPFAGIDFGTIFAPKASAMDLSSYKVGDTITYGSYPQSRVTDSTLISELETAGNKYLWVSYNYYSGIGDWRDGQMKPDNDMMWYKDIPYNGNVYRAVWIKKYRPYYTGYTSSSSYTYQDDYGFYTGNVYYFRYDPLTWRVLDPSEGFVMCTTAIDAQAYNNYIVYSNSEYYGNSAKTYYASDWANSSLRAWLNDDFYNTAFTSTEKSQIGTTYNENKSTWDGKYDSANTSDKIFLLSFNEVLNSKYGFSSRYATFDTARQLKSTDYAKCQGCGQSTSTSYYGNSWWRLRSPNYSDRAANVYYDGIAYYYDSNYYCYGGHVSGTYYGIVPAFKFNPKSTIQNLNYTQTHTVSNYASNNAAYAKEYLSSAGTALGTSNENWVIPGLKKGENMVPQGIAYYNNKVLITSYYNDGTDAKKPSMIFALDYNTGTFIEEYKLVYNDNYITGHVGGIAVSGNNIYVANGKYIYHLRAENMKNGTATFTDRKQISGKISGMSTEADCAYVSITNNVLWTGNFYDDTDTRYKKPADSTYNTNILGFNLSGSGDSAEWNSFKAKTASDYKYCVPNSIENIQCATVTNNKLVMVSSFGRKNDSKVYFADVSRVSSILAYTNMFSVTGLPMMEGFFVKDGYMYSICESAAYFYNGYSKTNKSKNPTDVVWKINLNPLLGNDTTGSTVSDVTDKNVSFVIDGVRGNTTVNFKQAWFNSDSSNYNHSLGQLCSQYAMIGYDDGQKANLKKALEAIGMDKVEIQPTAGREEVNYFIANRKITSGGKQYTLVFAGFIGSYREQWYSNFDPGTGSTHKGFNNAKNYVMGKLNTYINSLGVGKDSVKILITGHSRGAATANLVAADLIKNQQYAYRENIYTYAFATPNSTALPEKTNPEYKRIFNIVNPEDFVTKVMLVSWEYGRYGTSYVLPSKTNTKCYDSYLNNMQNYFGTYTGGSVYKPFEHGEKATYNVIASMTQNCPDVGTMYKDNFRYHFGKTSIQQFFTDTLCKYVGSEKGSESQNQALKAMLLAFTDRLGTSNAILDIIDYFVGNNNGIWASYFEDAHRAETYCAYMMSMSSTDMKYRSGYHNSVNCPVDVEVYDKETNELVGRIKDNVVDEAIAAKDNAIVMYVDGDSKQFWLPSDGEYDVKLIGNDTGIMDYIVTNVDPDEGDIGRTNFFDVDISDGIEMTGEIANGEDFVIEDYSLKFESGEKLEPTETINTAEEQIVEISFEADGDGTVPNALTVKSGDYVTVNAVPESNSVFVGWYIDGELVSTKSEYSFIAKKNIKLVAKFEELTLGDVDGDGKINSFDALLVLQHTVEQITLTDEQQTLADVNKDKKVNSSDALKILQYTVGQIENF